MERPELIHTRENVYGLAQTVGPTRIAIKVQCEIANRGNGIAIFEKLDLRCVLAEGPMIAETKPKIRKGGRTYNFFRERIIAPNTRPKCECFGYAVDEDTWDAIMRLRLGAIIVGTIWYRDIYKRGPYWTKFSFDYNPPIKHPSENPVITLGGFLMPSYSPRHNRYI
jgi:hypothetical protein